MINTEGAGEAAGGHEDNSETGNVSREADDYQSRPESRTDTITTATPG